MNGLYSELSRRTYALDDVFEAVHSFYDSSPVLQTSANKRLLWAAEAAYLNAQVEAGALSLLNVNIDCNNPDVAADIKAFRETAVKSHRNIILYHKTVSKLVTALEAASL